MISAEQREIIVELIRKNARILRGERFKALRFLNSLMWAQEAHVPEQFLLPFGASLRQALERTGFDQAMLPPGAGSLFIKIRRCGVENLAALQSFGERILKQHSAATEDAVLAGEAAALAGLYQDPGAFPAADWKALLKSGTCANGDKPKEMGPPADEWSERVNFGNACWRKPKPALLVTLLAAHVGDPAASPTPPMWTHLGLAILVWKDQVAAAEILELAGKLAQRAEVERGLAIAAHVFPELADWIKNEKLGIPRWERRYAVPIAARRLVSGERD